MTAVASIPRDVSSQARRATGVDASRIRPFYSNHRSAAHQARSMGLIRSFGARRGVRFNAMAYRAIGEHPVHVTPSEFHASHKLPGQSRGDSPKALKPFQFLVSPFVAAVHHGQQHEGDDLKCLTSLVKDCSK